MTDTRIPDGRWLRGAFIALERTIPSRLKKKFVSLMFQARFWDSAKLSWDAAVARLNECLRPEPDKRQFLKIVEVWAWMRHSGEHELFLAMAEDLGYRVDRIATPERIADLLKRIDQRLADGADAFGDVAALRDQLATITAGSMEPIAPTDSGDTRPVRFCSGDPQTF